MEANISVMDVAQKQMKMTINLKGMAKFRVRLKLVVFLLWLVQKVSPFPVIVNDDDKQESIKETATT